jgi:hypothetical protein
MRGALCDRSGNGQWRCEAAVSCIGLMRINRRRTTQPRILDTALLGSA